MPLEKLHERLVKHCQDVYTTEFLETHKHIENECTGVQCVFMVENDQLVVCFRGSDSGTDWRMNFNMSQSEYPTGSGCFVHSGFLVQWVSIEQQFKQILQELMETHGEGLQEVVFCGHSAGSQCIIAAYACKQILDQYDLPVKAVTFGSPRLGDSNFKDKVESCMDITRIVLDRDAITRVPNFGYEHVGKPIQIRDDCVLERETSTLEHIHWMLIGARSGDAGIRDHFISNYNTAVCKWLSDP